MRLSIEARVAAAVTTAFVALTAGAIGREQSSNQAEGLTGFGSMSNRSVNMSLTRQEYNTSLIADSNTDPGQGN